MLEEVSGSSNSFMTVTDQFCLRVRGCLFLNDGPRINSETVESGLGGLMVDSDRHQFAWQEQHMINA